MDSEKHFSQNKLKWNFDLTTGLWGLGIFFFFFLPICAYIS